MVNSTVVNLSITIESNLFVGNKYRAWFFEETKKKREEILAWHIGVKKMNNKHSQVFVKIGAPNVYKKSYKWNYGWNKFRAEDLHRTYCKYFRTNLLVL